MATAANSECDDWIKYVKESLEKGEVGADETKPDVYLFRIDRHLLRLKPQVYIPQVISIGPNHYMKSQHYEETDNLKLRMARALEKEFQGFEFPVLVHHIKSFEDRIRACYDKRTPYGIEKLSWMLALDASFILQFLKSFSSPCEDNIERRKETIQRNTPLWYAIKKNILMLQNQLPMFLLIEALCLTADCNQVRSPCQTEISKDRVRGQLAVILEAACLHFNPFGQRNHLRVDVETNVPDKKKKYLPVETQSHILHYLHGYVTATTASPEPTQTNSENQNQVSGIELSLSDKNPVPIYPPGDIDFFIRQRQIFNRMIAVLRGGKLPSATELREKGIKFAPDDSGDLGKISFNRATFTFLLPQITINDSTEVVLRNLLALELSLETTQKPLTRYIYLMNRLIDTEWDVAVLKRRGIFIGRMGSNAEVARMWKSMWCKSMWENTFDPIDQAIEEANKAIEEANKYYGGKWRFTLCPKPWLVLSILSAGILLLTAVRVFCLFHKCRK